MINIAVCDDQMDQMKRLLQRIQDICKRILKRFECHVYDGFLSAERVIEFMNTRPINILFLDIELNGINGFELAARLNEEYPETIIIFIIRLSAKGTDEVMKRGCFRLKKMIYYPREDSAYYRTRGGEWWG